MANPAYGANAFAKPAKGSAYLSSKDRRADRRDAEQKELQAALKREGRKCRWYDCTGTYRGLTLPIDPCHMTQPDGTKHRQMGGNPDGTATQKKWICALCRRHHTAYDAGQIDLQPLTDAGFDGPISMHERSESGRMECVAVESRIGVSEVRNG